MAVYQEFVTIERDVDARLIPAGDLVRIPQGTPVMITQALGGSYTVNLGGNLARIAGKDGDSLGKDIIEQKLDLPENATVEDKVWAHLKTVYDPEIPVNIVDLGLVYKCELNPLDDQHYSAYVQMTLTAPGCGMGDVLVADAQDKIREIDEIETVNVELVFDPPWDRDMISEPAKLELGLM